MYTASNTNPTRKDHSGEAKARLAGAGWGTGFEAAERQLEEAKRREKREDPGRLESQGHLQTTWDSGGEK